MGLLFCVCETLYYKTFMLTRGTFVLCLWDFILYISNADMWDFCPVLMRLYMENHSNAWVVMWSFLQAVCKAHTSGPSLVIFGYFSLAAILDGGRGFRIQFWKGTTHGPFHQRLVQTGWEVSEEKIFCNCWRTTDDGCQVMIKAHMAFEARWAKKVKTRWIIIKHGS